MKKIVLFLLVHLFIATTYSQVVKDLENVRLFTIPGENGNTIHFIKTDADIKKKKPTIIFLQGSLPIPLIVINETEGPYIASFSFNYWKLCEKYNLIEISMPHTPPIVTRSKLNSEYQYLPDLKYPTKYDPLFLRDNQLEKYVERANTVIKFLKKQPWVDANRIAVIGHSQGSYIAAELGRVNKSVKAIGYFAGNPDGRFTQYIRQFKRAALTKQITPKEAQSKVDNFYDKWKSYCKGVDCDSMGLDNVRSWVSFSLSERENLVKMKTPIFIAYGTEDLEHAESCDLLPIYFERYGKTNYKMMPFVGCGHNFEEISPEGKHDWSKTHWEDVMNGFVEWWESLEK
jgi:pimeloyl-ACP methyl ester carboxylesterase